VKFFIGQVLPYLTAVIFLGGMTWRVVSWLKKPVPFQLTVFPAPKTTADRVVMISKELGLFTSLYKQDKGLWFWAWVMHFSLAMVIVGHVVGIYFLTKQFTLIGISSETSTYLSITMGTVLGAMLLIALIVLSYRRTAVPEVRRLSDPADFFVLLLIGIVVLTGLHMRFPGVEIDLPAVRAFIGSVVYFKPLPIPDDSMFIVHFTFVNLLLIYFPFSKLVHLAGSVLCQMLVTEAAPKYPTPAGVKRDVRWTLLRTEGNKK